MILDPETIQQRTEKVGKTYTFTENQNPRLPAQYWFQNSTDGLTLFVVFYTQACRWSKCLGCNLPSKMSQYHVDYKDIMKQIDYIFDYVIDDKAKKEIRKIIISNNGSILDEDTFSTTALVYFYAKMNMECPNITTLTLETRPEYVDVEELEIMSRVLKEGETPTQLELAIGFEAFDDDIRNKHFYKGLNLEGFENLVQKAAKYKMRIKTYFMMKPVPSMTEEEGLKDIVNAINYLDQISSKYDTEINMHLNPTYVAKGTPLEDSFRRGEFQPPQLESVRQAVLSAEGKYLTIFVGLNDEGLAVEGGSCIRENDDELVVRFERFNRTQDYSVLKD